MYADGKPIVEITDISIRLSGVTKEKILAPWKSKQGKSGNADKENLKKTAIFDYDRIHAFAVGKPSEAFGEPYKIFDGQSRIIARLPGPPYQFLDRITEIDAEPWKMVAGGEVEAQYDVPDNAWYFTSNRQDYMPFAVLLEIALQPCGWLAAYIGSALTSEIDVSFRNLGGTAVQYEPVPRDAGILTTKVKITEVSCSGGMIVQRYDMEVLRGKTHVYDGNTYFGFFSKDALAQQLGIQNAEIYKPPNEEILRGQHCSYPTQPPFPDSQLRMIERIDVFVPDGGPFGLGYIRGSMQVDPDAWFFKAHFYQDPVIPGSLGLESGLQLLKFAAFERWGKEKESTMVTLVPGMRHEWIYRGQVIPANKSVTVDMWVTSIDDKHGIMIADGFLSVDGLNIYQLKDFSLRMEDSES
jgi:3-hydroxymyristoyl/3-hydroxydecanoyl-(acyl carrier protein) dehydratase